MQRITPQAMAARIVIPITARPFEKRRTHCDGGTLLIEWRIAMLKILTIALAFAALFVAEVKSQPKSSQAEVCNYNCLLSLQLASLDQRI
jgi:hypothetical protein